MTPEGWRRSRVSELGDVAAGKAKDVKRGGPNRPYLRVANVFDGRIDVSDVMQMPFSDEEFARYELRRGDILLNEGQSLELVGRCAMYRGEYRAPCAIQNALIRFRAGSDVDSQFAEQLFRWCQASGLFAEIATQTTSIAHLGVSRFAGLHVPVPPIGEQKKIAAILSSVDEAIEATQAVIDQLQVVKNAMMSELLTRGLPGRHTRFKQTEIGEVPEEWAVAPLSTIASIGNGSTPSRQRADYWDGGTVAWLPTGKVNERVITAAEEFVTERALAECPIRVLPPGTLLIAMIGQGRTRGKVAYMACQATINQNFAYVAPKAEAMDSWFLFLYLDHCYEHLRAGGRGSNQDALNCSIIKRYLAPVPPLDEQRGIAAALRSIEQRVENECESVRAASALKTALMSVLLTGDVRVKPDDEAA